MFVIAKKKDERRWQVQIVESVRSGKTVKQKIVRNVGVAHTDKEVAEFKRIAEAAIIAIKNARRPVLSFVDPAEFYAPPRARKPVKDVVAISKLREVKRINEGISDIFGAVYKDLGFDQLIEGTNKDSQWNEVLEAVVEARVFEPASKRATSEVLREDFDRDIPVQKIYRMLDHLADTEEQAKRAVARNTLALFGGQVDVMFFDVTTLYFESIERDELREFGFSKDLKFNQSQVMLALVATTDGLPITYELFPGNTFEGHTLIKVAKTLKIKYNVRNVLLVADRGMFNEANLSLMEAEGFNYIVAAKLRGMSSKVKDAIQNNEFKPAAVNDELQWIKEFDHKPRIAKELIVGRRLIVSYSPKRAAKDAADRRRLVERLLKKVTAGTVKISDVITNHGTKKYLKIKGKTASINESKIAEDGLWDGLHGVVTNLPELQAHQVLERYRGLWQIEEAFRVNKHSLAMRPIYHWSPRRIRAHVCLCFIAYSLIKHIRYRLKAKGMNLSFERIKTELKRIQASVVVDEATGKRYGIPSKTSDLAQQIYSALGYRRSPTPYQI